MGGQQIRVNGIFPMPHQTISNMPALESLPASKCEIILSSVNVFTDHQLALFHPSLSSKWLSFFASKGTANADAEYPKSEVAAVCLR